MQRTVFEDVTVVIPTLGRESLQGCLDAVAAGSAWPGKIVLVDQGANPDTELWVAALAGQGIDVLHVRSAKRGTAAAMNDALNLVATPLVAVTHDDCVVETRWLQLLATRLRSEGLAIVTGRVLPESGKIVVGTITSEEPDRFARPLVDQDPIAPGNMGFPIAVVGTVGVFDEDERLRFAEDAEWSYRALRCGIPIVYTPEVIVTHLANRDLAQRAATYRNYARSQGGFYGMYIRRRDWFVAWRAVYDLLRGPWMWIRGKVQRNADLVAYGRAYLSALPAGIIAGLRRK